MKRKWGWLAGGAVLVVLVSIVTFMYWFDPARRTTAPELSGLSRTVSGNTLFSHNDPPVRMTFDERFRHIGGQKFILYGTADVEQHFFVEEHPDGTLKSFVWIQFEGFLPDNDYTYDYSGSPLRLQIGDFDFYTDTAAGTSNRFMRLGWPGTDGYLARKFAADRGYATPDDYAYARLVHIPDAASRRGTTHHLHGRPGAKRLDRRGIARGWNSTKGPIGPRSKAAHLDRIKRLMSLSRPG